MKRIGISLGFAFLVITPFLLSSCSTYGVSSEDYPGNSVMNTASTKGGYASRLPATYATGEKTILVDPNVHAWGAYGADGSLVRAGLATAGREWCPDINQPCKTAVGTFRVQSLGSASCKSQSFPIPKGGAPMPYCMYFTNAQALHGSYEVAEGNLSHGCVRMKVGDAQWLRSNFANVGTKVVVRPY